MTLPDFEPPQAAAKIINQAINQAINQVINDGVHREDFIFPVDSSVFSFVFSLPAAVEFAQ